MGGLTLWIRSEWRTRWRALVALSMLIAVSGAVVMGAVAGARRADSAFDRLLAAEAGPIQLTIGAQAEPSELDRVWDELPDDLAAVPGVTGVRPAAWAGVALQVDDVPLNFFSVVLGDGIGSDPPSLHLVGGRAASGPDEVVINEEAARVTEARIGDVIEVRTFAPDQVEAFLFSEPAVDRGPRIDVEVVGIARGSEDVAYNPDPIAWFSTSFRTDFADRVVSCNCTVVVNARPEDVDRVTAAIPAVLGDIPMVVGEYDLESAETIRHAVSLEVGALWIAAVVAGIAALIAVIQMIARHIGARRSTNASLDALGATRATITRAWVAVFLPAIWLGTAGATSGAVALSAAFPRGLARRAEPSPGVRVDAAVIGIGGLLLMVVAISVCWAIAFRATSSTTLATRSAPRGTTGARPACWPTPSAAVGTMLAIDPAGDRSRLAAVAAVLGVAMGVGGFLAFGIIDTSADEVLHTPSAYAADWDLEITENPADPDAVVAATLDEPIDAFAFKQVVGGTDFTLIGPGGRALTQPFALQGLAGSMGPLVDEGRPATTSDDVVIGRSIADDLGAGVGDEIQFVPGGERFVVSGVGRISDDDETAGAAVVTMDGLGRLLQDGPPQLTGAYVRLGDADDGTRERLSGLGWQETTPPSKVANLDQIGSVPLLLAVALAAMGLVGILHALLLAASRREGDIAVVRALGFTPRQARATIAWQSVAVCTVGIVIGAPMGIVVGRVIWKGIAAGVGATDLVSLAWLAFVAVPLVTLTGIGAVAWLIGRRAAGLRPAEVLRRE